MRSGVGDAEDFQFPYGNYFYLDIKPNLADKVATKVAFSIPLRELFLFGHRISVERKGQDPFFQFPYGNYFYLDVKIAVGVGTAFAPFQFPYGNYFYLDSGPFEAL